MPVRSNWTRQELLVAFALYCQLPFGRLHYRNPVIIQCAEAIGRTPSALAMKLTNIASLDPMITSTGRTGLRGASAKDREMWQEMAGNWDGFALESQQALREVADNAEQADNAIRVGADRLVMSKARVGQNFFRSTVLSAHNYRCCITGLSVPELLVASHIIPWHRDRGNRLNPRNGLALSALHDKAFDAGLITINADMRVEVSPSLKAKDDAFFTASIEQYSGQPIHLPEKFGLGEEFLAFHREHIFQK